MQNKTKTDRLHDRMPKVFGTRKNVNWNGLIESIGQGDQQTADLIESVRQQFFVKTASRPYLDRLGANNKISRPPFIGMDDPTFRKYIPILAWQPKQVKLIIDSLLDIFFFEESTTSFSTSNLSSPFDLEDGWEMEYTVDGFKTERIEFKTADFVDISNATANEIVASWNRQAKNSFAISFTDSVSQLTFIRFFTNTVGSKGSIEITGGRANIALQFDGFLDDSGNGVNTEWTVTKVGDLISFEHTAGNSPGIGTLKEGDIILSNITDNVGSFAIENVDIANNKISFRNLFGTVGVFTQTSDRDTKFIRPFKSVIYTNNRRAIVWEVKQGEIIVEMPTSPPVVRRTLNGSAHHNGLVNIMASRVSATETELDDATDWPTAGTFLLEQITEIKTRILTPTENTIQSELQNTRLCSPSFADSTTTKFEYTGKSGNNLTGITPDLPELADLNEFTLSALSRTSNVGTGVTTVPHNYKIGEFVVFNGASGIPILTTTGDVAISTNVVTNVVSIAGAAVGDEITGTGIPADTLVTGITGTGPWSVEMSNAATASAIGTTIDFLEVINGLGFKILAIPTTTSFTFDSPGIDGTSVTAGTARVERIGMAVAGSRLTLTDAQLGTDILGPNIFDLNAQFVLSSLKTSLQQNIRAGNIARTIIVDSNDILNEPGQLIFDFGTERQEGPVRYFFKPTDNTIAIDPAHVFDFNHDSGSAVTMIRRKGPHTISSSAREYPPYVTDTAIAREILQDLILDVKSVGIFVEFLIRFPEQLYATIDVYRSGTDPG